MSSYPAPPPFDPTGGSSNSKPSNNDNTTPPVSSNDDPGGSSSGGGGGGGYPAPPPFDPNPKPSKPSSNSSSSSTTTTTNDGPATMGGDNRASYKLEFDKIDTNGSGSIDPMEIEKLFLGMVPTSLIKKAVSFVDTNRDGKIDFNEYAAIREKLSSLKKK